MAQDRLAKLEPQASQVCALLFRMRLMLHLQMCPFTVDSVLEGSSHM